MRCAASQCSHHGSSLFLVRTQKPLDICPVLFIDYAPPVRPCINLALLLKHSVLLAAYFILKGHENGAITGQIGHENRAITGQKGQKSC